jgi:hypothetical protein
MWRYFFSIIIIASGWFCRVQAQDTIMFPMKLRVGVDLVGASRYFYDKETANLEFFINADLDDKKSASLFIGMTDYVYPRYRDATLLMYNINAKGFYAKAGIDFNMLHTTKAAGKYFLGVGFRYGISNYSYGVSEINIENYWNRYQTSIPKNSTWGHFLEASPSVRVDIFRNISIGWALSVKKIISSGIGKEIKPLYLPGYGDGTGAFAFALNYSIIWNIPRKEKQVIVRPRFTDPEPEEDF